MIMKDWILAQGSSLCLWSFIFISVYEQDTNAVFTLYIALLNTSKSYVLLYIFMIMY